MKRFLLVTLAFFLVGVLILSGCAQQAPAPAATPAASPAPAAKPSAPAPAPAAPGKPGPAEFYKGKNLEFYVPSTPGSGLDTATRILAPLIQQETGATVAVINKPGGGYLIPVNQLYEKPDAEGLSMTIIDMSSTISAQLLGLENCRYDARKMNVLGSVSTGDGICVVNPDSPYKTMSDLLATKKTLVSAATGATTPTGLATKVVLELALALPVKVVTGYSAAPEAYKAVVQKEADVSLGLYQAAAGLIAEGKLKPIFVWQDQRIKYIPDVLTLHEAVEKSGKSLSPDSKYWLDVIVEMGAVARGILMSPGVPQERVQYLRSVIDKILKQQSVKDSFDKLQVTLYPQTGDQVAKRIDKLLSMEKSKAEQLKKIIEGK